MAVTITPEIEGLVETLFRSGDYEDRLQVLDEALKLLQRRQDLMHKVRAGVEQLDAGLYTEYDERSREQFRADILSTEVSPEPRM